ncbi:unnamed protein product [Adineta ricciae]|nr:unnamed protein product [Adineta ricciae]
MASCCRGALVSLAIVVMCAVFSRVQADLTETSTAHNVKITVSKEGSEIKTHFHVENATRSDLIELAQREDNTDEVEENEEKPKANKTNEDPYTKSVFGALDSMRTDFTNFNVDQFMKVVNDKNLVKKPTTTTRKPEAVVDNHELVRKVKAIVEAAQPNGENGQNGAVEVPTTVDEEQETQETADDSDLENAGSPYTKNLMAELGSMHKGSKTFDLGKLFAAINKDKEFQKGSTIKRTVDSDAVHSDEHRFGGNSTNDCACKTNNGVCRPVDAQQCLLHEGARIVKCATGGKWIPVEECKKTCEWSTGKPPVCVN